MLSHWTTRLHNLPRDSRDTLFLLLVIASVLIPQLPHLPLWSGAWAGTVLLWRGWLAVHNRPLPGRWWLLGLLAATLAATWFTHRTLLGRDAGITLLVVLLTLKTMELRARRDAFVVFFLGFFCMMSNFLHSQSLLTAFSMVLGTLGLLTVLVNAHMPVGKPPLLQAAKTAGWMALLGAPIMLVLFLLFPRLAPLWGVPSDTIKSRSGLSSNMRVGAMASLALDESIAMRVHFEGVLPEQQAMYFRGPVLSAFDGLEWLASPNSLSAQPGGNANLRVTGAPVSYEITMEPSSHPWLMVMDAAPQRPELAGIQSVMLDDLQWITNRALTDVVRYKVKSYPNFNYGPLQRVARLQEFVALPPGFNPRTLALAAQIKNDPQYANAGNAPLVQAALDRLRTGGYTYSLEPGVYGNNTADEFWFDRKQGFCEHITSAFVVLMRAMNVPARIVTGYQGGEINNVDGFLVVRQSNAHAWAEVWYAGRGWVRVDPTSAVAPSRIGASQRLAPPRGVVAQTLVNISPGLVVQLRATWEAVNNAWTQKVLNYTQGKQLNLLKDVGFEAPSWQDLSYVLIGIIILTSLASAAWALWERTQHDPWLRLLEKARQQLAKAGIESTAATSPRQLADAIRTKYKTPSSACSTLQHWLMQLEVQRYALASAEGDKAPTHAPNRGLRQLQQQFKSLEWPA